MIDLEAFRAGLNDLGPTARSLALPKGYLNAHEAHEKHQAQDRQDGQDQGRDDSPETVGLSEDRSSQEA